MSLRLVLPFALIGVACPSFAQLEATLSQKKDGAFLLTLANVSEDSSVAVSTHATAYEVVVKDAKGKACSSLDRYMTGIGPDGQYYGSPNLLVAWAADWVLLPPGAAISFPVYAYDLGGPLRSLPARGTATVKYRPEKAPDSSKPEWLEGHPSYLVDFPTVKPIKLRKTP